MLQRVVNCKVLCTCWLVRLFSGGLGKMMEEEGAQRTGKLQ